MKLHSQVLAFLTSAILCCAGTKSSAAPILEYLFNETSGTSAANSGSLGSNGNLSLTNSTFGPGLAGNAFVNSSATGMGANNTGGAAQTATSASSSLQGAFSGFQSLTITGWFNVDTAVGNGARILSYSSGSSGFTLSTSDTGNLQLYINNANALSTGNAFSATDKWVFFAVTYSYNTATSTGSASFYLGGVDSASTLNSTRTLNGGVLSTTGVSGLAIGNLFDNNIRPLDGSLDDIRVFGSSDLTGALSASQIEDIRKADVASVPEPTTGVTVTVGLLLTAFLVFRRRRINS